MTTKTSQLVSTEQTKETKDSTVKTAIEETKAEVAKTLTKKEQKKLEREKAKLEADIMPVDNTVIVIELVRRQGIYTSTLPYNDPKKIEEILKQYEIKDGKVAHRGERVTEINFSAVKGRTGNRNYCLRLPNMKLEDLRSIGFEASTNNSNYYISK